MTWRYTRTQLSRGALALRESKEYGQSCGPKGLYKARTGVYLDLGGRNGVLESGPWKSCMILYVWLLQARRD